MFTPGINDPGPWQWFVKRTDNVGLPLMEQRRKFMHEQLLFEDYMSTINTVNTVSPSVASSAAAAGAGGGPAPSTGGGGFTALTDANLSTAKNLYFSDQAAAEAEYGPIGQWNTTAVTNMTQLFLNQSTFNEDISGWDVSNVTNMTQVFYNALAFNQDISGWDVSSATRMYGMFYNAEAFNQDIGGWDVSNVDFMSQMFKEASAFNQDISGWDVSSVTGMEGMFREASAFNQDIGGWDVSSVTSMGDMFYDASAFDQDLGSWDMSNVQTPAYMFLGATSFNNGGSDSINNWDMTGVPNGASAGLTSMFQNATSFNQPLGNWDVTEVKNFGDMFNGATSFNQDLSSWTPTKMTGLYFNVLPMGFNRGFLNTAMSTANYDALLIAWSALTFTDTNIPFAMNQTTQYSAGAAATARGVLTGAPNNWTITDGGQA